jgi:hypothetical protein
MVIEGGTKRGVDRKVDLAGVTGRKPDALEFSVLKANEECAIVSTVFGAHETGDIIPGRSFLTIELVGRFK